MGCLAAQGALLALALTGCQGPAQRDPGAALGLRAQRLCREQMADLPAGTTARQSRLAYAGCLRSLGASPPAATAASPGDTATAAGAAAPGQPAPASAEERYLFCRLNSEAIEAAITSYNQARWILLNSGGEAGSPERSQAEAGLNQAVAALGEAIPARMRAGQDLVPDAIRQFAGCERSRFE